MTKAVRDFQIFAKPAGALCNLDCRYCYYLEKNQIFPQGATLRMSEDVLETYISQHIDASSGADIRFSWHGGEPTVLGLDYFRRIVALQRKHQPSGQSITNGIQTNGILLDEEWCRFLAEEGFGVGLSLDGPQELHDRYRVSKGGKQSHRQALRGFKLLRRYHIPCDLLCTVNDFNVRYPARIYRFFKEIGARQLGFLPIVQSRPEREGGVSAETVPAEAYGEFLCTIFDEWVREDVGHIDVQNFEEAARPARGLEHSLCVFRKTCGDIPVLEHNGDFYSCDHFVDTGHRIGNIHETPLAEMLESAPQLAFGRHKWDSLPQYCLDCEVLPMCNGGCPKDRFRRTPEGEEGWNYLCPGFKRFFLHALPDLVRLASMPPGLLHAEASLRTAAAVNEQRFPAAGRNDPCPCGSGRKYKKCCLGK